ncbi:C39 family peptidase [Anaerococcus sp. mt242]|uniref:C47 family peptidase n=1 Tax=Anaerococcus sp. mt242 TaxID=2661917 RepID=UPI001932B3C1|nr:C47 family peptidase [Anaerococcus sp. mt242]MBM0045992.1 C39 family peptidase [Anaerococcus sp. mt242]
MTFYPELEVSSDSKLYNETEIPSKNAVNIMEIENLEDSYRLDNMVYEPRSSSSKYIDLDLAETQGDQSWCSAFAGAQILRQRGKGKIYAINIMRYFYPNVSYADLKKKSISHKQLIKYANNKKSYPSESTGTLSLDSVKKQINSNKSIYLNCYGTGTYKKANHALVLRGYNTRSNTYSIWNPWNASYVSMSISSKSISVNGGKFVWSSTIYGW